MGEDDNDRLREYYDENAGIYDRWMDSYDRFMLGDGRARLCALASGRTLELAVGTGLNLPLYGDDVDVVGLDYSPKMLEVASARAARLGRAVELVVGDAHQLEFGDGEFDTVLTTLFLSSVPDDRAAAAEAFRVLKPGGRFLVIDHVRSNVAPVRWLEQRSANVCRRPQAWQGEERPLAWSHRALRRDDPHPCRPRRDIRTVGRC